MRKDSALPDTFPALNGDHLLPIDIESLRPAFSMHKPRILILYGSLREVSYSRLLAFEVRRLLERMGCDVRIFDPAGLPLPDEAPVSHPKVHELRDLSQWSEGQVWISPERHGAMTGIMKSQIDWIPLSVGSVRPTQGKTLAVMEVSGGSQSFNTVNQLRVLGRHQISLSYLALFVLLIGLLAFNTYQVPFLITQTGISEDATPPYLFAYGLGAVIGIIAGGRLADWKIMPSLLGSIAAYTVLSALILVVMGSPIAMFVVMFLLGVSVLVFQVQPQARIVANSAGAPTLAATFIATAFNLGYAVGALAGAGLLNARFGYVSLPVVGIVCGLVALAVSWWSWRLDKPT